MRRPSAFHHGLPNAFPPLIAALIGAALWPLLALLLPLLPELVRFLAVLAVFLGGYGGLVVLTAVPAAGVVSRVTLSGAVGLAIAAPVAHALGAWKVVPLFPYVAAAALGATVVRWRRRPCLPGEGRALGPGAIGIAVLSLALGAAVYAQRVTPVEDGVTINGDYNTYDSLFYAAIAAELTHEIPPEAPFYAGHLLNYSYYPHLVLAMVHRFGGVPLLPMFLGWAWPVLLALAACTVFVFVAGAAPRRAAWLAALLMVVGSDLSFIIAPFVDARTSDWDDVIWSSNLLSPGAETLFFNTFTPTLAVVAAMLAVLHRTTVERRLRGTLLAALLLAALPMFKPFAYAVVLAGLVGAALFAGTDWFARRRYAIVAAGGLLLAAPLLIRMFWLYGESQSGLSLDGFLLPRLMAVRLQIDDDLHRWVSGITASGPVIAGASALLATIPFIVLGWGFRLAAVPALWRTLRGEAYPAFRLAAWVVVAGTVVPFVLVTDPYYQTMHFYQLALLLLPIFVGLSLAALRGRVAIVAITMVIAVAVPSTAHYVFRRWQDDTRPSVALTDAMVAVSERLRTLDRDETVVLQSQPEGPAMAVILAGRRSLLAWSEYVSNSRALRAEVEDFFEGPPNPPERAIALLGEYGVTHVLVNADTDRLHPAVEAELLPLFRQAELTLYEVPAALRGE